MRSSSAKPWALPGTHEGVLRHHAHLPASATALPAARPVTRPAVRLAHLLAAGEGSIILKTMNRKRNGRGRPVEAVGPGQQLWHPDVPGPLWDGSRRVGFRQIEAYCRVIGRTFQPRRIILFGSYASGTATRDSDAWTSLAEAVVGAGFDMVNAHPLKAEMSVAAPKSQAKEPIQLDMVLVCRRREADERRRSEAGAAVEQAVQRAAAKARRLARIFHELHARERRRTGSAGFQACCVADFQVGRLSPAPAPGGLGNPRQQAWKPALQMACEVCGLGSCGLALSVNDRRVNVISQFLVAACAGRSADELGDVLSSKLTDLDLAAMRLLEGGSEGTGKQARQEATQLAFFERAKPVSRGGLR